MSLKILVTEEFVAACRSELVFGAPTLNSVCASVNAQVPVAGRPDGQ